MKRLFGATNEDCTAVAELLRSGEIVALPTETVYGLACLALNEDAVSKVFTAKKRPLCDPLIVHVEDVSQAREVCQPDERTLTLAEAFWPGPLTIVLPKKDCVPDVVTSGLATVAVRSPSHPVFREILRLVGAPLAAPSANLFGKVSPTRAEHVMESFGQDHPPVLDGGPTEVGIESTVLDLTEPRLKILRPGPITREDLVGVIGGEQVTYDSSVNPSGKDRPSSPGLIPHHYQPDSPLMTFPNPQALGSFIKENIDLPKGTIILTHSMNDTLDPLPHGTNTLHLSESGNPEEIARNLFGCLRQADRKSPPLLLCSLLTEKGIGRAINDRLRRAAGKC